MNGVPSSERPTIEALHSVACSNAVDAVVVEHCHLEYTQQHNACEHTDQKQSSIESS